MQKLNNKIASVRTKNYVPFKIFVGENELGVGEDITGRIVLVWTGCLCNVRKNRNYGSAKYDILASKDS